MPLGQRASLLEMPSAGPDVGGGERKRGQRLGAPDTCRAAERLGEAGHRRDVLLTVGRGGKRSESQQPGLNTPGVERAAAREDLTPGRLRRLPGCQLAQRLSSMGE
jgi:hypothetical protein